ncbi:MAG: DUF1223 domain-containing protein [Parvibaculum sp.]
MALSAFAFTLSLTPAQASERPIVVELFTSQGCSSCPPADAFLGELAHRQDVLALSLPVNIWDYLGWEDTFATPAFTQRQRDYVAKLGGRSVYTPQMVIDGVADAVGSREGHVNRAISLRQEMKQDDVPVSFASNGDIVTLTVAAKSGRQHATLWLVRYAKTTKVEIRRGENAGETITYTNVVRDMTPVAMWEGAALTLTLPKNDLMADGFDGCAAILQEDGIGPILGAATL